MFSEVAIVVAIGEVDIDRRWRPCGDERVAIYPKQKEGICLREILQPFPQEGACWLAAKFAHQIVWRADIECSSTRLHLLQSEIDDLHVARGLLGENHAEISHGDPLLFDGLTMQVPDCQAATQQGHDDEDYADCPQVPA